MKFVKPLAKSDEFRGLARSQTPAERSGTKTPTAEISRRVEQYAWGRSKVDPSARVCRTDLEVNDGAYADLEVILRAGIELSADIVSFGTERNARAEKVVDTTACLQCKSVLAFVCDLGIQVSSTNEDVGPGSQTKARCTGVNAASNGVENISGLLVGKNVGSKRGYDISFQSKPIIKVDRKSVV